MTDTPTPTPEDMAVDLLDYLDDVERDAVRPDTYTKRRHYFRAACRRALHAEAEVARLREFLARIHRLAAEDLRLDWPVSIWQIEADARAALGLPEDAP
jgi:hypothetical protein